MMLKRLLLACLTMAIAMSAFLAFAVQEKPGSAGVLKVKGDVLRHASRYGEALEYYTAALDKAKADNDTRTYNACIGNISNIYAIMGEPKRSLYYWKKGYEASAEAGDSAMMQRFVINIVAQYCQLGDIANAKVFFKKQMQLASEDPVRDRYYAYWNQGLIAQGEEHWEQALFYYQTAQNYATAHQMDSKYSIIQIQEQGNVYLQRKQFDKALQMFTQVEKQAREIGDQSIVKQAYNGMAQIYRQKGDSVTAQQYEGKVVVISDSLYDQSRFRAANDKLFEYENAENQRQIDRLVSRNHTQLLIILAFALFAGIVTWLYMALRRKNRNLLEAQQMLVNKNEELLKADQQNKQLLQHYVDSMDQQQVKADKQDDRDDLELSQDVIDQLLSRINSVMEQVDVISSSEFGLNQLAQLTGSNTKYVSWVINKVYGKNFKTFLNEYRIKEASKRLADQEHYGNMTIQAIYESLGYQSASAFISSFKKFVGVTPSTYQKLIRDQQPTPDQESEG